jgi:uracil-DNA glycosylase
MSSLASFVDALANTVLEGDAANQYASIAAGSMSEANAVRRANLLRYLELVLAGRPALLLVGETAGHRGCRLTGIPFTSEHLLARGLDGAHLFGPQAGFLLAGRLGAPRKEATATMVWQAIARIRPLPLLWNAFPFHPHRPGRPWSNRAPNRAEMEIGRPFLLRLIDLSGASTVVAVGRKATQGLAAAGVEARPLRHPSHGGREAFRSGLEAILHALATPET